MRNKRGSHLGVMLSFIIFIGFLIFLYSILAPTTKTKEDEQFLIDHLEFELLKNVSVNLTSITVSITDTITESCIELENINNVIDNSKLVIKDNLEVSQNYDYAIGRLEIDSNKDFFKIYSSDKFLDLGINLENCQPILEENYVIGLVKTNTYVFEESIGNLTEPANYENFKASLNLAPGKGFGFSFVNSEGIIIKTSEQEHSTNIYIQEIPIQYIDKNANILPGFINIKVW